MEDERNLPNCCYDYRFDVYEDGRIIRDDEYEAEMEDRLYEYNRDKEYGD